MFTVHCTAYLNVKIKITIKIPIKVGRPIKFSKNCFDLLVGSISVIFGGLNVFHVVL
jgi:hypothetical protein